LDKLYPLSENLNKKITGLIRRAERKQLRTLTTKAVYRVAAAVAIFFVLSFATLMSIEASRNFILNTFISMQDNHVAFEFRSEGAGGTTGVGDAVISTQSRILHLLPEGFEHTETISLSSVHMSIYNNNLGEQVIYQVSNPDATSVVISNQNRDFSIITISGIEVYVFETHSSDFTHTTMWAIGNSLYTISATFGLSIDLIISITQTLIYD
jgi:hypothetical protein